MKKNLNNNESMQLSRLKEFNEIISSLFYFILFDYLLETENRSNPNYTCRNRIIL